MMRDLLPNGLIGLAITGLLAAFMAGMAANISAFNTVFSVDIWQHYVVKDRPDDYYVKTGHRIFHRDRDLHRADRVEFLQHHGLPADPLRLYFNAPLFATFIVGMFWRRMTPTAGWVGLVTGTVSAVTVWGMAQAGIFHLPGQGTAFLAASVGFVMDVLVSIVVSLATKPKPAEQLVGGSSTRRPRASTSSTRTRRRCPGTADAAAGRSVPGARHHPEPRPLTDWRKTMSHSSHQASTPTKHSAESSTSA